MLPIKISKVIKMASIVLLMIMNTIYTIEHQNVNISCDFESWKIVTEVWRKRQSWSITISIARICNGTRVLDQLFSV